jgi:dynamin GTPase
LEKEVLKYGEAPTGIKEVFELCRGFERAYVEFVNVR